MFHRLDAVVIVTTGDFGPRILFGYPWKTLHTLNLQQYVSIFCGSPATLVSKDDARKHRRRSRNRSRTVDPGCCCSSCGQGLHDSDVDQAKTRENYNVRAPQLLRLSIDGQVHLCCSVEMASATSQHLHSQSSSTQSSSCYADPPVSFTTPYKRSRHGRSEIRNIPFQLNSPSSQKSMALATGHQHEGIDLLAVIFIMAVATDDSENDHYIDLLAKIALALEHEQLRCNFIVHESAIIFSIIEKHMAAFANDGDSPALTSPSAFHPEHTVLHEDLLKASLLAQHVKYIFESLKHNEIAMQSPNFAPIHPAPAIAINDWVNVDLTFNADDMPILRPYHALLSRAIDAAIVLQASQPSPLVLKFMNAISPTVSLKELSQRLHLPISTVYDLARNVIFWRQALLIDVIAFSNVYVVSNELSMILSNLKDWSQLVTCWQSYFDELPLLHALSQFRMHLTLYDIAKEMDLTQSRLFDMVTFLLRQGLIRKVSCYPQYTPISDDCEVQSSVHTLDGELDRTQSAFEQINKYNETEQKQSGSILASINNPFKNKNSQSSPIFNLIKQNSSSTSASAQPQNRLLNNGTHELHFSKLVPLMDGQHCVEEILLLYKNQTMHDFLAWLRFHDDKVILFWR